MKLPSRRLAAVLLLTTLAVSVQGETLVVENGGFEAGLVAPWGTGQRFNTSAAWWNSNNCDSSATIDATRSRSGSQSLHIINKSARAPNVFGTTQQPFSTTLGKRYRLSMWARANDLASHGAVSLIVNEDWSLRPVLLPQGTYGWTQFIGEFSSMTGTTQIRILSEDQGEVWLDDIQLEELSSPQITSDRHPVSPTEDEGDARFLVTNGGFEQGLSTPWGTGQHFHATTVWWNGSNCLASAEIDSEQTRSGKGAVHIVNRSRRAPNVYGTTQQAFPTRPGGKYRVTIWARASHLASPGGASVIVDEAWSLRPIQLPAGTYGWTKFQGDFTSTDGQTQVRLLSEDQGEVWIDDISVQPLEDFGVIEQSVVEQSRLRSLLHAVERFRSDMQRNPAEALRNHAEKPVREKFERIDRQVWLQSEPAFGWGYLLSTSVVSIVNEKGDRPLVAFYNPWCDVFLITAWQHQETGLRITDAELLIGDLVRTQGRAVGEPVPLWIREEQFKPVALGLATADSLLAFEQLFAESAGDAWRSRLSPLEDRQILEDLNYNGVAVLLGDGLNRFLAYHLSQDGEHRGWEQLRNETDSAMTLAVDGQIRQLLAIADQTLPASQKLLRQLPTKEFSTLHVVSTVTDEQASLIFLFSPTAPNRCFSLLFEGQPERQRLTRVDVVIFRGFYALRNASKQPAHAGGRLP
ncbi:MAG: hypothetical protein WEB58_18755 [Planctomycetaceae bacterium]